MEAFLLGGLVGLFLYIKFGAIILWVLRTYAIIIFISAIFTFIDIKIDAKYK